MRGRTFGCVAAVAVMVVVICGAAPPALAQTTWSITNPHDDGWLAASGSMLALTNVSTGASTSCSSARLDATVPTAAGVSEIGTWHFGEATDCVGPAGSTPTVWLVGPLLLYGRSYDPGTGQATLEAVPFIEALYVSEPDCDYAAYGSFTMTYTNSTAELVIDGGSFTVTDATGSGCGDVVHEGDTLELSATYTVTPAVTMTAAAPRFTVGGSTDDGRYTTTQSDATTQVLGDLTTGNHSTCSPASVAGRIPNGDDLPGPGIGSVTSANLGRCTLFPYTDGAFSVTPVDLPWRLDAASYVATDGGVVSGSIANFELSVSGPNCSFSVTATPSPTDWEYGEFNERPDVLLISPDDAVISNVTGCGGGFNDGDRASYSNGYAVSPSTLQITGR